MVSAASLTRILKNTSIVEKVLLSVLAILIVVMTTNWLLRRGRGGGGAREGFVQEDKFLFVENNDQIYDDFYVSIYDYLTYSNSKDNYEITEWKANTKPSAHSVILDIGCGRGHHISKMAEGGLTRVKGIDKSRAMVSKAKELYPTLDFQVADALKTSTFQPNSYTHITCFYFTIYYMEDKTLFFKNCYRWLKSGGSLTVHLVDRADFDPLLNPANPILFISPQKYAKKRITESKVVFKDFDYTANFELDDASNRARFVETFKAKPTATLYDDVSTRQQEHLLYMENKEDIVKMAMDVGFIIMGKVDLVKAQYEHQFLYIFQKPE